MDYSAVKKRIRHFLLQQDEGYRRSVRRNRPAPPMLRIAKSLDAKCGIGSRRLQKYLSDIDNEKQLSINLNDLDAFAKLANMQPGQFLSYLLEEEEGRHNLAPWKLCLIDFFGQIHHSLRRELNCTVFSGDKLEKREKLLDLLLTLDRIAPADLDVIERVVVAVAAHGDPFSSVIPGHNFARKTTKEEEGHQ